MKELVVDKILGLDISDYSIEILGLQKSFLGWGRPKIINYNRAILKPGIVENGRIIQPRILINCLKNMLLTAWPRPIKNNLCLMSFPESQVFSRLFKIPASISKEQIKIVILNEVSKLGVISLEEIYYDWQIYRRNSEEFDVFFVAVDRKLVFQYTRIINAVGLIPLAYDLELACLGRSLLYPGIKENVLIVDIGARATKAGFFENSNLLGTITIPIGGNNFTTAIAEEAGFSVEEAEAIKRDVGFDLEDDEEIARILEKEALPLIYDLDDFIAYFEAQKFKPAKKIILAGGSSLLPGIKDFFKHCFDVEVEIRDPFKKIFMKNYKVDNNFILYANVLGLALRGLKKNSHSSGINLLSRADYDKG